MSIWADGLKGLRSFSEIYHQRSKPWTSKSVKKPLIFPAFLPIKNMQQYLRYLGRSSLVNGQQSTKDCFAFGIQPSRVGTILGSTFLEGFEVEFDRDSMRVRVFLKSCKLSCINTFFSRNLQMPTNLYKAVQNRKQIWAKSMAENAPQRILIWLEN